MFDYFQFEWYMAPLIPIAAFLSLFIPLCIYRFIELRWGPETANHPAVIAWIVVLVASPFWIDQLL